MMPDRQNRPCPASRNGGRAALIGLLFTVLVCGTAAPTARAAEVPPATVPHLDLSRYAGLWYETARIPNRFQSGCERNATARYVLRDDGLIDVTNRCLSANGKADSAQGVARVVDTRTNARLEVSFVEFWGWRPFWGDYWVLGLAGDYGWAVVGTPDRRYGWVLSRTPVMEGRAVDEVHTILRRNGYDPAVFEDSPQDDPPVH